ncbi:MAG: hypothetical protein ALECFALPRED_006081 [Alectoria fallacina]|uniref:Uncharacterized protein n=1 Tax=Alectoria fallacina TaxID=1903189 RepID=A0A8H3G2V7_9LECA|nr:MAG: hypothetical protein ALECFALPRED_006081 [Alectoria fallacina]
MSHPESLEPNRRPRIESAQLDGDETLALEIGLSEIGKALQLQENGPSNRASICIEDAQMEVLDILPFVGEDRVPGTVVGKADPHSTDSLAM